MAAVQENQFKRGRRTKQMDGRRSKAKVCAACRSETRWVSVDNFCWDCTVAVAKSKVPLHVEPYEEASQNPEVFPGGTIAFW